MTTTLATTDDLIAFYKATCGDIPNKQLEAAIPAAIDAIYTNRDAGGNMHSAGAAAAIAAIRAVHEVRRDRS